MSNFDYPVLDGIAPSWADIQVRAKPDGGDLIKMGDIAAINCGWTVEVGMQKEGGRVINRTRGDYSAQASWTLYASGYQKLLRALKAQAPLRGNQRLISLVHFLIHVQWTPPGSDDILEYKIKSCRMLGRTIDSAEGTAAQQIEVPLSTIEVVDIIDGEEIAAV